VLGKKERKAIMDVGRNPYRREGDVDEQMRPTRCMYEPDGEPDNF